MLELLNRYAHGLVVIPIVDALRSRGCLEYIVTRGSFDADELRDRFQFNEGYLAVALRLFESLGWLRQHSRWKYLADKSINYVDAIPADIMDLYRLPFEHYEQGTGVAMLGPWLSRSVRKWDCGQDFLPDFMDGIFMVPWLLALKRRGDVRLVESAGSGSAQPLLYLGSDTMLKKEMDTLFVAKRWADSVEDGVLALNAAGTYIWRRIHVTAALASYRPMFLRAEELMFGDPTAVFALREDGHEQHLDRTLNVLGSGFQHEKYFQDLSALIAKIFDNEDFERQPGYIADTGCGDGSLLRSIHDQIRRHTRRGRVIDRYPLVLIGIDANAKALAATEQTLAAYEHQTFKGNVGDPASIVATMRDAGIDTNTVLHVRSFLDHDRLYRAPQTPNDAPHWKAVQIEGVHIDTSGALVPPADVVQDTIEHLARWSKVINRHGLIVLEVHALSAAASGRFLDEAESLHFDAYHAMSRQLLLDARTFLMCAAEAGLSSKPGAWSRYPKNLPFSRIVLNHFDRAPYSIRYACGVDAARITSLGCCWCREDDPMGVMVELLTVGDVARLISEFPEGQFVAVSHDEIVGAALCERNGQSVRLAAVCTLADESVELPAAIVDFIERYFSADGCDIDWKTLDAFRSSLVFADRSCNRRSKAVAADVRDITSRYANASQLDPRPAEQELADFVLRRIVAVLQTSRIFCTAHEKYELSELRALVGVATKYHRYFDSLLNRLRLRGWIELDGEHVTVRPALLECSLRDIPSELAAFQASFQARHRDFAAALNFVLPCLHQYEKILSGELDVAEVMFAEGKVDLFSGIFQGEPSSEYFNDLVAAAAVSYVRQVRSERAGSGARRSIRILEVGAGSGATTNAILNTLAAELDDIEFCITDISQAFVRHAQRRFGDKYPQLTNRVLDIGSDVSAQGIDIGAWDLVVAGNVLHDTRDMVFTLGQVARLLRPGGLLIANEYTEIKEWHFAGGALLHGMWLFDDPSRRLEQFCLLSVPHWRQAIMAAGMLPVDAFALPAQNVLAHCGQAVLIAECSRALEEGLADGREAGPESCRRMLDLETHTVATVACWARPGNEMLVQIIEELVRSLLGSSRLEGYSRTRPVMEMGLDSVELVELKSLLGARLEIALQPAFLFEYQTVERIAVALESQLGGREISDSRVERIEHFARSMDVRAEAVASAIASSLSTPRQSGAIAVVGIACRFPGDGCSPKAFWEFLERGGNAIAPIGERLRWPSSIDAKAKHRAIDHVGHLPRIDEFDAQFFRISPREAELMDPQQRLLLELSWEVFEDAGCRPSLLREREVGVFIGACHDDYRDLIISTGRQPEAHVGSGSARAALANRLSYFYDVRGPSLVIDTACSSSLVALHYAVESIRGGECEQALVGAVNLICSPLNSMVYYSSGMLSPSGICSAFDAKANGFVRGEGGAMLLLKPLERAVEDGDSIYGLVLGSALGHGGQAASFTAPRPVAQAAVIERAMRKADVDARTIRYIEAHGTGTALGDPVEIAGIIEAFRKMHGERGDESSSFRCAIGSLKPNIGHLEAAAGLAGLVKVLLAMRHRCIPKTLQFTEANPEIALSDTPFYIVKENEPWEVLHDENGQQLPRRAGISSFGSGGTNVHVVLEEYIAPQAVYSVAARAPSAIVLSAKDSARLREQAQGLFAELMSKQYTDVDLVDIAYTLQVGREPMDYRLGLLVNSIDELKRMLSSYLQHDGATADLSGAFAGVVKEHGNAVAMFNTDPALRAALEAWAEQHAYPRLLELWVQGLAFDWTMLYRQDALGRPAKPRRISLPTYPFARQRFWLEQAAQRAVEDRADAPVPHKVHPLLQGVGADSHGSRFDAVFSGEDFFLRDHIVKGARVLPGVAHLEWACAAAFAAYGRQRVEDSDRVLARLSDVAWLRPIVVDRQELRAHIRLRQGPHESIGYEIGGTDRDAGGNTTDRIYSHGRIELGVRSTHDSMESMDFAQLGRGCAEWIEGADLRDVLRRMGVVYGESFHALGRVGIGSHSGGCSYAIGELALPSCVAATSADFFMHPSVMDAALQASLCLLLSDHGGERATATLVPFALDEMEVWRPCPIIARVYACVRGDEIAQHAFGKIDLSVCNERGELCIRLRGLTVRSLKQGAVDDVSAQNKTASSLPLWLAPRWDVAGLIQGASWPSVSGRVLVVGGNQAQQRDVRARYADVVMLDTAVSWEEWLRGQPPFEHVLWLTPCTEPMDVADERQLIAQSEGVSNGFRLAKALLRHGYGTRRLGWTVVTWQTQAIHPQEPICHAHAGIQGLVGALAKEQPNWRMRMVDLPLQGEWPLDELLRLPADQKGNAWACRAGEWYRQRLLPCKLGSQNAAAFRRHGVYVVIGGAGGVGAAFSEHVIREYQAQVIWLGRRTLDEEIQAKLDRLARLGPTPRYISTDATDRLALESAHRLIVASYGRIDGVIHSAIDLQDRSIQNMDEQKWRAALAAKLDVGVRLAQVFQSDCLDFVLFFSSMMSFMKAPGQGNYATGCTYLDAFAQRMNQVWSCAVKVMNWGYWGSVGIVATPGYAQRLVEVGMTSIEPADGMEALETLLSSAFDQIAYLKATEACEFLPLDTEDLLTALPGEWTPIPADGLQQSARAVSAWRPTDDAMHACAAFDAAMLQLLRLQLRSLGLPADVGIESNPERMARLIRRLGIAAPYGRWLEESLRLLGANGYQRAGQSIDEDARDAWLQWEQSKPEWKNVARLSAQIALVEPVLQQLPSILRGDKPATDVLFPGSSMARVKAIYKSDPVFGYFNEVLAETLSAYVDELAMRRGMTGLRILEVGAGTGGSSDKVLARLEKYQESIAEYAYTDVSQAFLLDARQRYTNRYPFLKYRLLDVERSLAEQSFETGHYDVVIAANVLHATCDIRNTLRRVKAALRRGGVLLMAEVVDVNLFTHLTFGLLKGWWSYQDDAVRVRGAPVLAMENWLRVLAEEGFSPVLFPLASARGAGQQIIVAQSDGILRECRTSVVVREEVIIEHHSGASDVVGARDDSRLLQQKVVTALKRLAADALKMPVSQIEAREPLEKYGIDSILVMRITSELNEAGIDISSATLFEHQTVEALATHLMQSDRKALLRWMGRKDSDVPKADVVAPSTHAARMSWPHTSSVPSPVSDVAEEVTVDARDVAIVGISGRYAGSRNLDEFWANLRSGKNCITEIPIDRWDWRSYGLHQKGEGGIYSKWGGFLDQIDCFDPTFFRLSPREAEQMDPQERLFLEEVHAAIEDAGHTPESLSIGRKVGVFVGVMDSTYAPQPRYWSVANRISYLFDFHGPSMAIDTACSSSLTAIHLAVQSIRDGTCECAVAGGVHLIVDPVQYARLSELTVLSGSDQCKPFGEGADGFVDGEGVGAIVVTSLSRAIERGDHIYGVIKGTAINAGGKTQGYMVPNPRAQAEVVMQALSDSRLDARMVSYVEAHGTGTELGDPIEVDGLTKAFRRMTAAQGFCAIGSVKSSIGHCESAAGIAGLSKVLLQLKHRKLAPSLHCDTLNPRIDFARSPFAVQQCLSDWHRPIVEIDGTTRECPRIAGISSFGAGGANAHIIVAEYAGQPESQAWAGNVAADGACLIPLSAKSEAQLRERIERLLAAVDQDELGDGALADLAYTLQVGREAMVYRVAVVTNSLDTLRHKLNSFLGGAWPIEGVSRGQVKKGGETAELFEQDAELQEAVVGWLEQRKCGKLAELWVRGVAVAWERMYVVDVEHEVRKPRRLALPTYPFVRERYWAARAWTYRAQAESVPTRRHAGDEVPFVEAWQVQEVVLRQDTSEPRLIVALLSDPGCQREVSEALAQVDLTARLVFVAHVDRGNELTRTNESLGSSVFTVDDCTAEAYAGVFSAIRARIGRIDAVWSMRALENPCQIPQHGSILGLLQGLVRAGIRDVKVWLAGEFCSALERSHIESWIGYARSIERVQPDMHLAVVHAEGSPSSAGVVTQERMGAWAQRLYAEMAAMHIESALYMDGVRQVLRQVPLSLGDVTAKKMFRDGGAYLITGGMGGIGYAFATYLARRHAARLVLLGRSSMDEEKRARIAELEALGGTAVYLPADVADIEQMRAVWVEGERRFGGLNGVIHSAGVAGGADVLMSEASTFDAVLSPKVAGSIVLEQLVQSRKLDFVCYFSSIAAVLGDFGACDYAVASRFELAYAKYASKQAIAICWPMWANVDGMGLGDEQATHLYLKSTGQQALDPVAAITFCERVLLSPAAAGGKHVLLMVGERERILRTLGPYAASSVHEDAVESEDIVATAQLFYDEITTMAAELIKLPRERIDPQENFADLGFDSLALMAFAKRLSLRYRIDVLPSVFYSHTSPAALSRYLLAKNGPMLALPDVEQMETFKAVPENGAPRADEYADAIAIVGMSGRFPAARNVDEFWAILESGRDVVGEIPLERFDWRRAYAAGEINGKWLGVLPGVDEFDPTFFEISPREAEQMDPRQRLLLQEAYSALEGAGYIRACDSPRRIGMFVGVEQGDYQGQVMREDNVTANHDGILAGRLSYFLNLKGPVMAINTACSSGLVAVHQACLSLRAGECEAAVAAAANLLLTPRNLVAMSRAGMLSPEGLCRAFDQGANGLVPGEAVVAVVLKRLADAQADGDIIHAVIRGSGVNYDGKTNGLTAPNGEAQAELIREVHQRAGITARDVDYVVAHGTGTRLGDPVEVNALLEAFGPAQHGAAHCALTSPKTNVGHTFAASGLVSLVSAVLALRHELIPASLHCERPSDFIAWEKSSLYINRSNRDWPEIPGRARVVAISAFGMSGTNAHLVLQSHRGSQGKFQQQERVPCGLLLLSAKHDSALKRRAAELATTLNRMLQEGSDPGLSALGHALFAYRHHFSHRCALVASNTAEAVALLKDIAQGETSPGLQRGVVPRDFSPQAPLNRRAGELISMLPEQPSDPVAYQESLHELGSLYCRGYALDIAPAFRGSAPRRLSLPTYPFARERYWTPLRQEQDGAVLSALHPLLHRNESDLSGQRFGTSLSGEALYLRDHQIRGERVLPGVCYLEMAREAFTRSAGVPVAVLKDVVWSRPLVVDERCEARIEVAQEEAGTLRFAVSTADAEGAWQLHAQGRGETASLMGSAPRLDLAALRAGSERYWSGEACYVRFAESGLVYGASHRGLQAVSAGTLADGTRYVLARVTLPASVRAETERYVLLPGLLDSALQAAIGLSLWEEEEGGTLQLGLPFALERLEQWRRLPSEVWVHVRPVGEKLDLWLCDEDGEVCVRLQGLSTRVAPRMATMEAQTLLPSWEVTMPARQEAWPVRSSRVLLMGASEAQAQTWREHYPQLCTLEPAEGASIETLAAQLADCGQIEHLVWIAPAGATSEDQMIAAQASGVMALYRLVKALLSQGYGARGLGVSVLTWQSQAVHRQDRLDPTHGGIAGLVGSLAKEYPGWKLRWVDLPRAGQTSKDLWLAQWQDLPADPQGDGWCLREGAWYRQVLLPCELPEAKTPPYREGGVYVVIGGAGGLGAAWSEHLIRDYRAQMVWIGRRAPDATLEAKRMGLAKWGPAPMYIQADATDVAALERAYQQIKAQYGRVDGVVHAAIELQDQSLVQMEEARFEAGLRAKVDVSVHLARVFGEERLDFMLFFSSLQSQSKLAGQANYAAGCTFKDGYAQALGQRGKWPVKIVNWGYWGSVGVVATEAYRKRMAQAGVGSIEPAEAMALLQRLLGSECQQVAFLKTEGSRAGPWTIGGEVVSFSGQKAPSLLEALELG